ncbi:MAG: rhomboid family intramembrane serine protease [Bacteroidales bacterium]|nr:rhomboid family intramembrane serine protease [Bacteroidales bacterium]
MEFVVYIVIGLTVLFSYLAWKNNALFEKYLFSANRIVHHKEYFRMISHAFLHANWMHLIVNMLVLWSFGSALMTYFGIVFGSLGALHWLLLYLLSIIASSLYSLFKHKNNAWYSAVGASGATSAVVFACIFFDPWNMIYFFGVIPIPGILFGAIYLIYSYREAKRGADNIGHDAHFWGAMFGFFYPLVVKPELLKHFISQITILPF